MKLPGSIKLACDFCEKSGDQIEPILIAESRACICAGCVDKARKVVAQKVAACDAKWHQDFVDARAPTKDDTVLMNGDGDGTTATGQKISACTITTHGLGKGDGIKQRLDKIIELLQPVRIKNSL